MKATSSRATRIVREASTDFVLLLDDDAWLLDDRSVLDGIALLAAHPQVGAVAFAMAVADGSPWPENTQPAPVDYTCAVPCFIGFAHLLRRDVFLRLGGYRESFHFYGEEKDYCLRLLDVGLDVVYMPLARVVHAADIAGRSHSKYVRHTIRNDCLGAIYNEPFPLPFVSVPLRLRRYVQMRGAHSDPGGLSWIIKDLVKRLPSVLRDRRPVRWSTLRRWRRLRRQWPAWVPQAAIQHEYGQLVRHSDTDDYRRDHQLQSARAAQRLPDIAREAWRPRERDHRRGRRERRAGYRSDGGVARVGLDQADRRPAAIGQRQHPVPERGDAACHDQ